MFRYFNMNDDFVRWGARIFIVLIVLLVLWLMFRNKKTYDCKGIKSYYKQRAQDVIDYIVPKKRRHRGRRRGARVNKTEERCRKILQRLYGKKFPSVRPSFLKNPVTKKNLELDCYNDEMKLALEYNGQQHYKYTPYFHKSKKNFYSQVHRDDWKRRRCRELGIKLIEVPHWVAIADLEEYIIKEIKQCGAPLPPGVF